MLPGTEQIGEFEVDQFHVAVFDHFTDVGWSCLFGHNFRSSVEGLKP